MAKGQVTDCAPLTVTDSQWCTQFGNAVPDVCATDREGTLTEVHPSPVDHDSSS